MEGLWTESGDSRPLRGSKSTWVPLDAHQMSERGGLQDVGGSGRSVCLATRTSRQRSRSRSTAGSGITSCHLRSALAAVYRADGAEPITWPS